MSSDHEKTRASYDAVAEGYAKRFGPDLSDRPWDRAALGVLVEEVGAGAAVADLGCGPGRASGWLAGHGVRPVGIDLSPGMLAIARREHPEVEFREGNLLALPAGDGEFDAATAFYSLIHLGPERLPAALVEIGRVLRPGGLLLFVFHVGTEVRHLQEWLDQRIDLDFHYLDPELMTAALAEAGFTVQARVERASRPPEAETRRCYLLASRND